MASQAHAADATSPASKRHSCAAVAAAKVLGDVACSQALRSYHLFEHATIVEPDLQFDFSHAEARGEFIELMRGRMWTAFEESCELD